MVFASCSTHLCVFPLALVFHVSAVARVKKYTNLLLHPQANPAGSHFTVKVLPTAARTNHSLSERDVDTILPPSPCAAIEDPNCERNFLSRENHRFRKESVKASTLALTLTWSARLDPICHYRFPRPAGFHGRQHRCRGPLCYAIASHARTHACWRRGRESA